MVILLVSNKDKCDGRCGLIPNSSADIAMLAGDRPLAWSRLACNVSQVTHKVDTYTTLECGLIPPSVVCQNPVQMCMNYITAAECVSDRSVYV